ncbi:MAG: hypothetical protein J0M37_15540 [Ignavibacteria bacterium]|nr:hypothetical protein [Ignavibacteria bacterium]
MSIKDTNKFHLTTTHELIAIKDRVRNLIDHWGEEGKYKEAILKTVIKRFLPEKYSIVSGFVVRQTDERGKHEPSPQIDIIVYDNSYPTMFKEGDFAIVTPDSVKAIIEVKANLKNQKNRKIIHRMNKIGKFVYDAKMKALEKKYLINTVTTQEKIDSKLFNGIFSYTGYEKTTDYEVLKNYILSESINLQDNENYEYYCVNHISFNKNKFYKFVHPMSLDRINQNTRNGYIFELKNLSFSYFISNLLDYLSDSTIDNSYLWYPTDKSFNAKARLNFEENN